VRGTRSVTTKRMLATATSIALVIVASLAAGYATAGCTNCSDHKYRPKINGLFKKQNGNAGVT